MASFENPELLLLQHDGKIVYSPEEYTYWERRYLIRAAYRLANGKCCWCGITTYLHPESIHQDNEVHASLDHLFSKFHPIRKTLELQPCVNACRQCNSARAFREQKEVHEDTIVMSAKTLDFTVVAMLIHKDEILLIRHKKLDMWLPPGGHIEPNEDPIEALFREIEEETGIQQYALRIMGELPPVDHATNRALISPRWMDRHVISDNHEHVGMMYIVRVSHNHVSVPEREITDFRWANSGELDGMGLAPNILYYAKKALHEAEWG